MNWYELHEGFTLPRNVDPSQFPPYGEFDPDLPDPLELLVLPWRDAIPGWAWAAWSAAERADKLPTYDHDLLETVAWRKYGTARYVALVPAWRRWLTDLATEIDDIEDQVSTIAWLLELIAGKIIPIPPRVLGGMDNLRHTLDDAGNLAQLSLAGRSGKAMWKEEQARKRDRVRAARTRTQKIMLWLQDNYGRLLEAAQATGTWFDLGIILGPIFGYINEGMWGLASKTVDNYLIAIETILPGYSEDFYRNAEELTNAVEQNMAEAYEELFERDDQEITFESYFGI